jgi:hypothetical protein
MTGVRFALVVTALAATFDHSRGSRHSAGYLRQRCSPDFSGPVPVVSGSQVSGSAGGDRTVDEMAHA